RNLPRDAKRHPTRFRGSEIAGNAWDYRLVRSASSRDHGPTIVIPTTTDWDVRVEGGTESFVRNLAREGSKQGVPIQILSTGSHMWTEGSVEVRPVIPLARTELMFVRALRRKLKTLSIPAKSIILANAEH